MSIQRLGLLKQRNKLFQVIEITGPLEKKDTLKTTSIVDAENPPKVPEFGESIGIATLLIIPLAIIPVILKKRRQKKN